MKSINSATARLWEKTKRTVYSLYLVAIISAVPVLGFIEWSHGETKKADQTGTEIVTPESASANLQSSPITLIRAI